MKKILLFLTLFLGFLSLPQIVFAHEVYVLTPSEIQYDLRANSIEMFGVLKSTNNLLWFLFFAFSAITSLFISFLVSFSRWGVKTAKKVEKLSWFALPLIRIILGISLLSSAYYHSLFGPELPLSQLPGGNIWTVVLYITGVLVIAGFWTRMLGVVLLGLFLVSSTVFGNYMWTYVNYLGEIFVLILFGGDKLSFDYIFLKKFKFIHFSVPEALAISLLRISFAVSLLYAAMYAKFFHTALTYHVAVQYHMERFFPFDPLFVVLGAGCVEVVIGILFLFGINMRWNILFFAFWATLSLVFFGEAVWPHYILFGISIGLFLYGYDKYTLEQWLVKRTKKLLF